MAKPKMPSCFGGRHSDAEFQKMTWEQFRDYAGGKLSVALFKGDFQGELSQILILAEARGQRYQWELDNLI